MPNTSEIGANTLLGEANLGGGNDRLTIFADATALNVEAGTGKDQLKLEGDGFSGFINGDK